MQSKSLENKSRQSSSKQDKPVPAVSRTHCFRTGSHGKPVLVQGTHLQAALGRHPAPVSPAPRDRILSVSFLGAGGHFMRQMRDFPEGITKVTPESQTFSKAGGIWPGDGEIHGLL